MSKFEMSRRTAVKAGLATTALTSLSGILQGEEVNPRKKRIRQSVCRWCYQKIALDDLCASAAQIGLVGVDLLQPEEYEVPRRHGIICTMGYAGGGEIAEALNRTEHHSAIEAALRVNIPLASKAGVPNVITFSGNRRGMTDEEG